MRKKAYALILGLAMLLTALVPSAAYAAGNMNIIFTADRGDYVFEANGSEGITVSAVNPAGGECKFSASVKDSGGTTVWSKTGTFLPEVGIRIIPYNSDAGNYILNITIYADDKAYTLQKHYSVVYAAQKSSFLGIQNGDTLSQNGLGLDKMARAGMSMVRLEITWSMAERERGVYSMSNSPDFLANLKRAKDNGMEVFSVLGMGNRLYYQGDDDRDIVKLNTMPEAGTEAFEAYLNYCEWIVGALKEYGVETFMIWNEPNNTAFNRKGTSAADAAANNPKLYADLIKAAAPRIKKANPNATIVAGRIAGGCASDPSYSWNYNSMTSEQYIEGLLKENIGDYIDVFSIHPYMAWEGPPDEPRTSKRDRLFSEQISNLQALMEKYDTVKPIWITEVGFTTGLRADQVKQNGMVDISEEEKGVYNARTAVIAMADNRAERLVFHVMEYTDGFVFLEKGNLTPKDSYFSVAAANRFLEGKTPKGKYEVTASEPLTQYRQHTYAAYLFGDDNNRDVLVMWARGNADSTSSASVSLSDVLSQVSYTGTAADGTLYDWLGNNPRPVSMADTIDLDYKPVFIVLNSDVSAELNGSTVTVRGQSSDSYIGVTARNTDGKLIYINQFDTEPDGGYEFSAHIPGSKFTVYISDSGRLLPFEFNSLKAEIESVAYDGDNVNVTINRLNYYPDTITVILAFYDSENRLMSVRLKAASLTNDTIVIPFADAAAPEGCSKIKCTIWDMDTQTPLSEVKTM